jgi:hypothetical protein
LPWRHTILPYFSKIWKNAIKRLTFFAYFKHFWEKYKTLRTKKKNCKKKKEPCLNSGYAFGKTFSMKGRFLFKK